jgi:hypothetical protein
VTIPASLTGESVLCLALDRVDRDAFSDRLVGGNASDSASAALGAGHGVLAMDSTADQLGLDNEPLVVRKHIAFTGVPWWSSGRSDAAAASRLVNRIAAYRQPFSPWCNSSSAQTSRAGGTTRDEAEQAPCRRLVALRQSEQCPRFSPDHRYKAACAQPEPAGAR